MIHRQFADCVELLVPGDVLVLNDTRVSAVRVIGKKLTGGVVEALILNRIDEFTFQALLRPGRRLPAGSRIQFAQDLEATVLDVDDDGIRAIEFLPTPQLWDRIVAVGTVPLPPYIHAALADTERYQTVYGSVDGSAAAPTAGLHFTPKILGELSANGVTIAHVTLHVSLDTFRPVQVEKLDEHVMHGEICEISSGAADLINRASGRIIAVGTTTVRTLESFAIARRHVGSGRKVSKLFIRPGYDWQVVDGMFTNFHLPRTTMLAMISALAAPKHVRAAYDEAIRDRYRFLSFGDSMLIL